jgi:hypothetical protein
MPPFDSLGSFDVSNPQKPAGLRSRLEKFSPLAYIPILTLSALSLIVASLSLRFAYLNYSLQTASQPPDILFSNGDVAKKEHFLRLYWDNVGKADAWHANTKLYNFEAGKRTDQSFASADIVGAGGKVRAGYGGVSEYTVTADLPLRLLACLSYTDADNKNFENAVVLTLVERSAGHWIVVDETPPPDAATCR